MLHSLGLYQTKFEPCLIQDSLRFFQIESSNLSNMSELSSTIVDPSGGGSGASGSAASEGEMTASTAQYYLYHVDYRMKQVNQMIHRYLIYETSRYHLIHTVENTLLSKEHTTVLIESGFSALLHAHRVHDLSKLYSMLSRLEDSSVSKLCTEWSNYIK